MRQLFLFLVSVSLVALVGCGERGNTTTTIQPAPQAQHSQLQPDPNSPFALRVLAEPNAYTSQGSVNALNLRMVNNTMTSVVIHSITVRLISNNSSLSGDGQFVVAGLGKYLDPILTMNANDPAGTEFEFSVNGSPSMFPQGTMNLVLFIDLPACSVGDTIQVEILELETSIGVFDPTNLPSDIEISPRGFAVLCH